MAAVRALARGSARFPRAQAGKIFLTRPAFLFKQQGACYNKSIKSD